MRRRNFLKLAGAAAMAPAWAAAENWLDLSRCAVAASGAQGSRETKAAQVLVEEAEKRCGLRWPTSAMRPDRAGTTIYLGLRETWNKRWPRCSMLDRALAAEGFALCAGQEAQGPWIAVAGADERGLLFGVGKLLRLIEFQTQQARVNAGALNISSHPEYRLRGHQLGYRPKTNAYDAWDEAMWEQYIRDLAIFGTNAIELIPPRSDDLSESPHFRLPPGQMMVKMSQIADSYGMDVWVWYPAMDPDYSNAATVESALQEWDRTLAMLPRLDAVLVPSGDPGHTEPKYLLALLQKQKENLRRRHPRVEMWVSPQGFGKAWMDEFLQIVGRPDTQQWLDGIVYGPMSRLTVEELRRALPRKYPIRCYPDITHSLECQYPVPDWDVAYALSEGREIVNPRPESEAGILRSILPGTVGFIAYSEGCNDDANKFLWSALGWDSRQSPLDAMRDFAHYFIGPAQGEGFAQGLMSLERNWRGPLAVNREVEVTLRQFQDMESRCSPAVLENWRFQQGLYRAYFDAFVRARLLDEMARCAEARNALERLLGIGWGGVPLGIGDSPAKSPPNGLDPEPVLAQAQAIVERCLTDPAAGALRLRIRELAAMLFQSIRMQLAVEFYRAEAVERAANLDTMDAPVNDAAWLRERIVELRKLSDPMAQIAGVRSLLYRTDPGAGGFYDALGDTQNRPHLVLGQGGAADPDFRRSPLIGFRYPDTQAGAAPVAWKCWAETLYDAPLSVHYTGLDPHAHYRLRVVHSGDAPHIKLRLTANGTEVHPYMLRAWPPAPQEFDLPAEAAATGELTLTWSREPGLAGNGRGCQVAEVWLIPQPAAEQV